MNTQFIDPAQLSTLVNQNEVTWNKKLRVFTFSVAFLGLVAVTRPEDLG